jgi:hypothetical protein
MSSTTTPQDTAAVNACSFCLEQPCLNPHELVAWGNPQDPANPKAVFGGFCRRCNLGFCFGCAEMLVLACRDKYWPIGGANVWLFECPFCRAATCLNVIPSGQPCTRAMMERFHACMTDIMFSYFKALLSGEDELALAFDNEAFQLPQVTPMGQPFNPGTDTRMPELSAVEQLLTPGTGTPLPGAPW